MDNDELGALDLFHYYPANVYPQVCIAVFALIAIIITYQIIHYKARRWLFILTGTAIAEAAGYAFRYVCVNNTTLGMYIAMNIIILLSPNALALVNYKATGEVIRLSGVHSRYFWMRAKFVTWFFFGSDMLVFIMQGSGGGMMASDMMKEGRAITIIGLVVQLIFLTLYIVILVKVARSELYQYDVTGKDPYAAKKRLTITLYITTGLIYVRSIYRLIEYIDGYDGKVAKAEWAFYVFDTIIIFLCFVVYIVRFIGNDFPKSKEFAIPLHDVHNRGSSTPVTNDQRVF